MTKLAVEELYGAFNNIKVNDIEMKNGAMIPTAVLLQTLAKQYPNYEFSFICGSDCMPGLHLWQ